MARAKVMTDEKLVVEGELVGYKEIEYMQRNIGAVGNGADIDSKASVIAEVNAMFADGWSLFATHYGGDKGGSVVVMHIFVR
jgi:hypothetical protein